MCFGELKNSKKFKMLKCGCLGALQFRDNQQENLKLISKKKN